MHRNFYHVRLSYFLVSYLTYTLQQHIIAHSLSRKITDKLHHFVRNLLKSLNGLCWKAASSTSTPNPKEVSKYQEIPSFSLTEPSQEASLSLAMRSAWLRHYSSITSLMAEVNWDTSAKSACNRSLGEPHTILSWCHHPGMIALRRSGITDIQHKLYLLWSYNALEWKRCFLS